MPVTLTVIVVHPDAGARRQLGRALAMIPSVVVAGEHDDLVSGLAHAHATDPAILVVGVGRCEGRAWTAAAAFAAEHPECAVVVQADRLSAAACFLPLTVNPELSRTLGSRHRAAIGVTEDTDAVALVVSEETGGISLVSAGSLNRIAASQDLSEALRTQLRRRGVVAARHRPATS